MIIDWRGLLSELRIEWIDRGPNTSSGNVNIRCPFCADDPSYHMGVALQREAFYCYRDPNKHSGRSFVSLLIRIGQPRSEAEKLLRDFRRDGERTEKARPSIQHVRSAWDRFLPASQDARCLAYLAGRGFNSPRAVCETYDLRRAGAGTWARRLLLPLRIDGEVISWTGRDIGHGALKYKFQEVEGAVTLYLPDFSKTFRSTLVITEGPFDALKIADACATTPIIVAALCGKHLGISKLLTLKRVFSGCDSLLLALDADVKLTTRYSILNDLVSVLKPKWNGLAQLPAAYADPAEIPTERMVPWLTQTTSKMKKA